MSSPPAPIGHRLLTAATAASLAAGSLVALVSPISVGAQEVHATTANAVPADAVSFTTLNLDFDSAQWLQVEELVGRLGLPGIIEQGRTGLLEESDGEVTEAQLDAFFGGEIGFYILPEGISTIVDQYQVALETAMATPEAVEDMDMGDFSDVDLGGFGAVYQPGDVDATWDYLNEMLAAEDVSFEASTVGDVEVLTIDPEESDGPEALYVANAGEVLVITLDQGSLDLALAAAADEADSLADTDAFNQVLGELPEASASFTYIDSARLVAAIGEDLIAQLENLSPQVAAGLDAQGYSGIALYADDDGFRVDSVMIPVPGGDLSAIVPDGTATYATRVPASTSVFFDYVMPDGAWDSAAYSVAQLVNAAVSGEQPAVGSFDQMFSAEYLQEQLDEAEQILGFNLLDDFFGQFSGETAFALTFPDMASMTSLDVDTVFATEVDDAAVVADSVERLVRLTSSMAGDEFPVSTREVGDDTVYVFGDPSTMGIPAVEVGVIENNLLIGTSTGVDGFVNGAESTLADDEDYTSTLALLPGGDYYQIVYLNLADIIPTVVALSGMSGAGMTGATDADPACLDYASQTEAQEAFDADPFENSNLDQDFDSQACEDFFAAASPAASPAPTGGPEAMQSFAAVAYEDGGNLYSSGILYIPADE